MGTTTVSEGGGGRRRRRLHRQRLRNRGEGRKQQPRTHRQNAPSSVAVVSTCLSDFDERRNVQEKEKDIKHCQRHNRPLLLSPYLELPY